MVRCCQEELQQAGPEPCPSSFFARHRKGETKLSRSAQDARFAQAQ